MSVKIIENPFADAALKVAVAGGVAGAIAATGGAALPVIGGACAVAAGHAAIGAAFDALTNHSLSDGKSGNHYQNLVSQSKAPSQVPQR